MDAGLIIITVLAVAAGLMRAWQTIKGGKV